MRSARRTPWSVARRWLAAVSFCAGSAIPALSSADDAAAAGGDAPAELQPDKGEVVLVGSSSFNQSFGFLIVRELETWGYRVTRRAVSGSGLARPDFHDMQQELEALPISSRTAAVFVYLGVNDAQALWLHPAERGDGAAYVAFDDPRWETLYARRAQAFLDRICQRGAQRAFVLLPVDVNRADMQRRLERIREIQVRSAAQTRCAAPLVTAGDLGRFEEPAGPRRLPDGFHMTSRGALLVWKRVEPEVLRLLEADQPQYLSQR